MKSPFVCCHFLFCLKKWQQPFQTLKRKQNVFVLLNPLRPARRQKNPRNVAYTSEKLRLHIDLAYYESPPGLQASCSRSKGGGRERGGTGRDCAAVRERRLNCTWCSLVTTLRLLFLLPPFTSLFFSLGSCLHVCLSVCLSDCPSFCLPCGLFKRRKIYLPLYRSLYACLSFHIFTLVYTPLSPTPSLYCFRSNVRRLPQPRSLALTCFSFYPLMFEVCLLQLMGIPFSPPPPALDSSVYT